MCDPVTLAIATMAAAAVSAYGQYQAGKAQESASEYNAQVQEQNARVAEQYAKAAEARGDDEARQRRIDADRMASRQMAVLAAKGIDISTGTPLDILGDTAMYGELDAQTIKYNAALEAYQQRVTASNALSSAELSRMEGRQAAKAGNMQAVGTLIGGAAKAGNQYMSYSNSGSSVPIYNSTTGSAGYSQTRSAGGTVINWR